MIAGWAERIEEEQDHPQEWIAGAIYQRIRYGADYPDGMEHCRDCGVAHGQVHVDGCCVERCARCGDQRMFCGCESAH